MKRLYQIFKWTILLCSIFWVLALLENQEKDTLLYLDELIINTSDHNFISKSIIYNYLKENDYNLDSLAISFLEMGELESLLLDHPFIRNAEVYCNQKGDLGIIIDTREAIVRIKNSKTDYYIDSDGLIMPLSSNYTARVIMITGDVTIKHHKYIIDFITLINNSLFWKSQITQLEFINDEVTIIPRVGDHKIYFGELINLNSKLDYLYAFYKKVFPVKGWKTYRDISLKYNNQIVCTKR